MAGPLIQLILLIEEEFRGTEGVRIRPVTPSTTRRAADLQQDYDPESSSIHRVSGVRVQTRKKEYFFPEEWMSEQGRSEIDSLVREIHEALEDGLA